MSTPVFIKFREWLEGAGLVDGYKVQMVQWVEQKSDTGNMKYIVFQPNGGSPRVKDLSADDNVQVVLVSAKNDVQTVVQRAQDILDHVTDSPEGSCLNSVFNLGGMPTPIPTEEGRTVIRLLFRCTA